jgi:hypothetical protein
LDGEAGTGAERAAFQLTDQFLTLMLDPFVDGRQGRLGSGGGGAIGFAPEQQENLPPDIALAYAAILKKAPPPTFDQRWTAWGTAFGGSNRANGDAVIGSTNVTAQTFGFAAGMDYHVSPNTIAGFALAGAGTNWGLANALGTGRSDAAQVGAYAITYRGPAYLAGALAFTNHWFTTNRAALGAPLSANFLGQSYGARLEGGWRFGVLPTLGVTPYGALQAQDFHTASYNESDPTGSGFGLAYNAMNATDVRTELGSRFDAPTLVAGMPLILRGRLAWAHDFVSNPALGAVFQALRFKLHGQRRADPARFRAHVGRRRTLPDAALDAAGQVRGRVRQRLADLRRLGYAALCVVNERTRMRGAIFGQGWCEPGAGREKDEPRRRGRAAHRRRGIPRQRRRQTENRFRLSRADRRSRLDLSA